MFAEHSGLFETSLHNVVSRLSCLRTRAARVKTALPCLPIKPAGMQSALPCFLGYHENMLSAANFLPRNNGCRKFAV